MFLRIYAIDQVGRPTTKMLQFNQDELRMAETTIKQNNGIDEFFILFTFKEEKDNFSVRMLDYNSANMVIDEVYNIIHSPQIYPENPFYTKS